MIDIIEEKHPLHRAAIITSISIALILFFLIMYNETPLTKGKSTFYLPSSSPATIIQTLEENGYELNAFDRIAMMFIKSPDKGWYRIDGDEVGRFSFWKNLHKKQAKSIRIIVYAGETSSEILHRFAREMLLSEAKLKEYHDEFARFKEGNILAGKYRLSRSSNEETVMRHVLDNSYIEMDFFAREEFGSDFNETQLKEALIIASIIQKESNDIKEMPSISSVIQNRLKKGMRLQMDGTLNYGKYVRTIVTPERIKTDKSRYNTYKYKGLVPAPLGSVSIEALQAAVSPSESDYLFFVLNAKGKHVFAETYQKHLKNVKVFKAHLRQRDKMKKDKEKKKQKVLKQKTKQKEAKQSVKKPVRTTEKKVIKEKTVTQEKDLKKKSPKKTIDSNKSRIQKLFSDINATKK
ncbi:endolytic transglycosylase MltG [bacterium]|nr:endolytic transglycosylase MltG [bacterium]